MVLWLKGKGKVWVLGLEKIIYDCEQYPVNSNWSLLQRSRGRQLEQKMRSLTLFSVEQYSQTKNK